ncbi:CHAP domain-containing protein [Staphylococcus saprophyticus]|uniref:CHAP domain-containing protein n=1 Tax=Staphylococcus saprophyticus TaxID=29385 RepID=UPI0022EAA319|nr:CHAP domain-containing protein [Staphylococcus saprophyticus]
MRKGNMVKGASKKAVKMAAKAIATKLNISLWYVWAWVLGILAVILLIIVIFGTIITAVKIEEDKQKEQVSGGDGGCQVSGGSVNDKGISVFEKNAKGGALEGKSEQIQKIAKKHNVPPKLFMAIIASESQWGKGVNATKQKNPLSVMGAGTINSDHAKFDTIEKGLEAGAKNLDELYISKGLTTPEKIGPKYAPTEGATNDPTGMNNSWIPTVKSIMSSLGDGKGEAKVSCDSDVPAGKSIDKLKKVVEKNGGKLPKTKHKTFEPNTYNYKECTWYVYNRRKELGLPVTLTFGNGGDWVKNAKAQGYKTGKEPKVGAMVSWPYNSEDFGSTVYGHIAFVEEVKKNGEIRVSEHNIKPFAYGERTFKPKKDLTFIY